MTIRSWSTTAASNNSAVPNGWPEGMAPSGVNNAGRQMMADIRDTIEQLPFFDYGHAATRVDADTFTVPTDQTAVYTVGRSIKLVGASTQYGTISSSSYSAPDTTVNIVGTVPTSLSTVSVGIVGAQTRYDITAAEIAASVTPTNYQYPPGYVQRYMSASQLADWIAGTGLVDQTTAFQAMHDGNSCGYAQAGLYLLNQTAVASVFTIKKSKFTFIGDGPNTILYHSASGVVSGTETRGVVNLFATTVTITDIRLANFRVTGPTANTGAVPNSTNRMVGICVHDGTSNFDVTDFEFENLIVEKMEMACYAFNGKAGPYIPRRGHLKNCIARYGRQDGFNDFAAADGLYFEDCHAFDLDGFCHELTTSDLLIEGGSSGRCGQAAIGLEYNSTLGANKWKRVRNHVIYDIGTTGVPLAKAFSLGQSQNPFNTEISDCSMYRIGGAAIAVNLVAASIIIKNNNIREFGRGSGAGTNDKRGVQIPNACTYVDISDNTFVSSEAGSNMEYGIVEAGAGSVTNRIANNKIYGETLQKIYAFAPTQIFESIPSIVVTASVGNVGAGVDTLQSATLLARTLMRDGQSIIIDWGGTTAANGNNKEFKGMLGAATLFATGAVAANNKLFHFRTVLTRSSSSTFTAVTEGIYNATAFIANTTVGGFDFTVDNTLKGTGEATADDDIVQNQLQATFPQGQ